MEWSWLLYRCMPLRPTGCTLRAWLVQPTPHHVDVLCVGVVVDRVRLGHPHDVAWSTTSARRPARVASSSRACRARSARRRASSRLVPLVDEVLEARGTSGPGAPCRATRRRSSGRGRAHLGRVDVDPVVREGVRSRATTSATVRKSRWCSGRRPPPAPRPAAGGSMRPRPARRSASTRSTASHSSRVGPFAARRPSRPRPGRPRGARATASWPSRTSPPPRDDLVAARLPHHPGAEPRVLELLDQRRDLLSDCRRGSDGVQRPALPSDRFLMRWAAQSAWISVGRHAPDLLGVGLEEDRGRGAGRSGCDPTLEVAPVRGRPHAGPG